MTNGTQLLLGLTIGILLLILLILKTKIHVFPSLIIAAAVTGLIGGLTQGEVVEAITRGFGTTLGNIGIVIGFGVMMGKLLELSGATRVMARSFLKLFGKGREDIAVGFSGFITSLSMFCDSGFIILFPLAKALSKGTKKSIVTLGVALAGGLVLSHSLVPPAAGPVGVAGIFEADVGRVMLYGAIVALPMLLVILLYARYIGQKIYQIPSDDGEGWLRPEKIEVVPSIEETDNQANLPAVPVAFAPILLPIALIISKTIVATLMADSPLKELITFIGTPVIAIGIGLLIAIGFLTSRLTRAETLAAMESGIKNGGKLLLITGAGGSLGTILRESGTGDFIAQQIVNTNLPSILLPFAIATLVRLVQGSGTVAMLTAASITAPMVVTLQVDPVLAAVAACVGSLFFSYFNDTYYWVINESLGIENVREQIRIWSITTTLAWSTGLVMLLLLNWVL